MSSENLRMTPNAFDREVPPLKMNATDPEVLLDDDRRNATPRAGFVKEAGTTASVKACEPVHYGTSTSLRRTGRIHAEAVRRSARQLMAILVGQLGASRIDQCRCSGLTDVPQRLNDGARVRSRGDEILRRRMFQSDHTATDLDRPGRSVRQVGRLRRHLQRHTEHVGRLGTSHLH